MGKMLYLLPPSPSSSSVLWSGSKKVSSKRQIIPKRNYNGRRKKLEPEPTRDGDTGIGTGTGTGSCQKKINQCYVTVKGAALVLPQNECAHVYRKLTTTNGGDIQFHLQCMLHLLRPEDTLKMAVKLESIHDGRTRYLAVVSCLNDQQQEESCLLGVDCRDKTTIGLVLAVWPDTRINLDGDGGFSVCSSGPFRQHIFKPVSVQAMWSALQSLHKASDIAGRSMGGLSHSWIEYYEGNITSDQSCLNEWNAMDDLESRRPPSPDSIRSRPHEKEKTEQVIRLKLKGIMMTVDLDEVTSKIIRTRLEEELDMNLQDYKSFIDQEMLTILGQMDSPSKVFEYLYLGSEWNASNLDELQKMGIRYILNVTREIDNFFPGLFKYQNIRVYDDESTELLKHWDHTYKFITNAKEEGAKVLVHCKMGVSRSASVVVAYAMKAYDWKLERAREFVKSRRPCICPNTGFVRQLEIYEGILDASKQRHNTLWRSKSETSLKCQQTDGVSKPDGITVTDSCHQTQNHEDLSLYLESPHPLHRPKSWSPDDNVADSLFEVMSNQSTATGSQPGEGKSEDRTSSQQSSTGNDDPHRNHVLLPCDNGQSFSVSPNKALFLPIAPHQQMDTCSSAVTFRIGDEDSPTDTVEGDSPEPGSPLPEDLNEGKEMRHVPSVKDLIIELESQSGGCEPRSSKDKLDLPGTTGLVHNLASQFEGGSQTTSPPPSPVSSTGEIQVPSSSSSSSSCSPWLFATVNPLDETVVENLEPIVSQTKQPANRQQAFIVRPETWEDPASSDSLTPTNKPDDVFEATFQTAVTTAAKLNDPFSMQVDKVFEREERTRQTEVPSRQDSWGSADSAVGLKIPPSRQGSWGSRDTPWKLNPSLSSSVDTGVGGCSKESSSAVLAEEDLGVPEDKTLKRTGSFDDRMVTDAEECEEGSVQRSQSLRMENRFSRIVPFNPVPYLPIPYGKPVDKKASASLISSFLAAVIRPSGVAEVQVQGHYASSPALGQSAVEGSEFDRTGGPVHSASQPNITNTDVRTLARVSRAHLRLELENVCRPNGDPHSPDDGVPYTGIVKQQKEVLENMISSTSSSASSCASSEGVFERTGSIKGSSPAKVKTSPDQEDNGSGVVRRILQEIEAKGSVTIPQQQQQQQPQQPPQPQQPMQKKVVIVDQQGRERLTPSPIEEVPDETPPSTNLEEASPVVEKSVRSLVGKFEVKDGPTTVRTRYHSENIILQQTSAVSIEDSSTYRRKLSLEEDYKSPEPTELAKNMRNGVVKFPATVLSPCPEVVQKPPPGGGKVPEGTVECSPRKTRMHQGKTHPLTKLTPKRRHADPMYNTM